MCETIINIISQLAGVLPVLCALFSCCRDLHKAVNMSLLASRSWHFSTKRLGQRECLRLQRGGRGDGGGLSGSLECGLWALARGLVREP